MTSCKDNVTSTIHPLLILVQRIGAGALFILQRRGHVLRRFSPDRGISIRPCPHRTVHLVRPSNQHPRPRSHFPALPRSPPDQGDKVYPPHIDEEV